MTAVNQTMEEVFNLFRDQAIWLRNCYNTYQRLYENDEQTTKTLNRAAAIFFHDLNSILIEYLFLLIGRITDRKSTFENNNLSVMQIDDLLERCGMDTSESRKLSEALQLYGEATKDVRNKIVAHNDLATHVANKSLGATAKNDVVDFFENLQKYCDEVGRLVGVGPLDFRWSAGAGDVVDLISRLSD